MPLMDEFKEEREAIKNADFKTKAKYYLYYYKLHIIAVACALILVITLVHDIATHKDNALFAAMLNSAVLVDEDAEVFLQNYAEYAEIDTTEYDIQVDTTINFDQTAMEELAMSAAQRLMVYTATGELDVIAGGSDIFPAQAGQGMFHNLKDILTAEQIAKYEPYFYYVDQAVIDEWDEIASEADPNAVYPDMPDPFKPEEMEQPIPVGLLVTDCDIFTDTYYFRGDYAAVGVMINAPNLENAIKFIDYIFE